MNFELSPDILNPIYSIIRDAVNDDDRRFIVPYGGSSSSKTFSIVQVVLFEITLGKAQSTIVFRKYSSNIRDSIYADFKSQIQMYGLSDFFVLQQNLIKCTNGAEIRFRGLDDSEKVKGISAFHYVYLNEVTEFDVGDLKQVRKRLRGKKGQKIIIDFNPISSQHWIKTNFIDGYEYNLLEHELDQNSFVKESSCKSVLVIKTSYLDNWWVVGHPTRKDIGYYDKHTIADFEHDKKVDPNYYKIYALGEWGTIHTGHEFYRDFKHHKHVDNTKYKPEYKLLISIDENVNPYFPAIVCQNQDGKLVILKEYAMKAPNNNVNGLCEAILKDWSFHESGITIYGDATSRKQDTKLEYGSNLFHMIKHRLRALNPVLAVPLSNPNILKRGIFINSIFRGDVDTIEIVVGSKCGKVIDDIESVQMNGDGTKQKERTKDKISGITYEKYGHFSDCLDYIVCELFRYEFRASSARSRVQKEMNIYRSFSAVKPQLRKKSY